MKKLILFALIGSAFGQTGTLPVAQLPVAASQVPLIQASATQYNAATAISNANLAANHFVNGSTDGWAAGPAYPGFYASDNSIAIMGYPSYYTSAQILGIVDTILALTNGSGDIPAGTNAAGTTGSFYSAWDSDHNFPMEEGVWGTINMEFEAFRKTGTTTHFATKASIYETALARIPVDSVTKLAYSNPAAPLIAWGFQEIPGFTGNLTFASLMLYSNYTKLATMYTAAGNASAAATASAKADAIKASLQDSSALWNATDGMYHPATIGCSANIDIYSSAYAVYLGVASSTQTTAIAKYFVANYTRIFQGGFALQTVNSATTDNWAVWGQLSGGTRTTRTFSAGQYQNGRWSVANLWIEPTMALASPAKALQYANEGMANAAPNMEWFDNVSGGNVTNGSATNPNLESPMGSAGYIRAMYARGATPLLVPSLTAAGTANDCVKLAANGIDITDAGAACGTGGSSYPQVTSLISGSSGANSAGLSMLGGGGTLPTNILNIVGQQSADTLNAFYNGTNWVYQANGAAAAVRNGLFDTASGGSTFYQVVLGPIGTAGAAVPNWETVNTALYCWGPNPANHCLINPGTSGPKTLTGTNTQLTVNAPATVDNAATVFVIPTALGNKGVVVQGQSGQTANLFEAQSNAGAVVASVSAAGTVSAPLVTPTGTSPTVASASTVALITNLASISGTAAISSITAETGFTYGCKDILATGAWTTVAGASANNIATTMTAVSGTQYRACKYGDNLWRIK